MVFTDNRHIVWSANMDGQVVFDIILGVASFLASWILKTIWDAIKVLQRDDKDLAEKLSHIEVLVAGQYVKTDKFDQMMTAIFTKLDRIEDKLDTKVDK